MNKALRICCLSAFVMLCIVEVFANRYTGEYYWNTDPGLGKATKIPSVDIGSSSTMQLDLNTSAVSPGINVLGVRVFNGQWSPTVTSFVFVPASPSYITKGVCEYFWETDPGLGEASQFTFNTNGSGTVTLDIPTTGVKPGVHRLGLRTFVAGNWSPTVISYVFVLGSKPVTTDYVEYFWGDDPGFGNGTRIKVSASQIVTLTNKDIQLPKGPINDYRITVRARSSSGQWGPSYYKVYSYGSSVNLTLDEESITIDGLGDTYKLTATVTSDNPDWPRPVTWLSSDEEVATVDKDGNVKAIGKGTCVISAECSGTAAYAECTCTVTGSRYILRDAQVYELSEDAQDVNVTYIRNFQNTNWQPLYLPYRIRYQDWCDDADVAELVNAMMYDDDKDGVVDRTVVEFQTVKEGELLPHTPYLIRSKQIGEVSLTTEHCSLLSPAAGYIDCTSTRWVFTLRGTYQPLTDEVHGPNTYIMSGGKFMHTNSTLNPFRFYLQMTQRDGGYWGAPDQNPYPEEIGIVVDGEPCGIEGIIGDDGTNDMYYDVLGRKMENPTPGIYIQKGNKVIIR